MASRRLALKAARTLRSRPFDVVIPIKRGFATPVGKNNLVTETTTLLNGLTVGELSRGC